MRKKWHQASAGSTSKNGAIFCDLLCCPKEGEIGAEDRGEKSGPENAASDRPNGVREWGRSLLSVHGGRGGRGRRFGRRGSTSNRFRRSPLAPRPPRESRAMDTVFVIDGRRDTFHDNGSAQWREAGSREYHPFSRRRRRSTFRQVPGACNTFWKLSNTAYLCRKVGIAIMDGPTATATDRMERGARREGREGDTIKTIAPRSLAPSRQEEGSNTCSTCVARCRVNVQRWAKW